MKRILGFIAVGALLLAVTGCGAAPMMKEAPPAPEKEAAPRALVAEAPAGYEAADEEKARIAERMVIHTVELRLIVKDTQASLEAVQNLAGELGGYIASSRTWHTEEQLSASLTLRVPADQLNTALEKLRALALEVDSESISGEDVTQEYVDLEARLRNEEAYEKELLALLTETRERTSDAEDVLAVYERLTEVRGRIEQTKGRMQYLENMSAMATITVELIPSELMQPITVAGWHPTGTARSAIRALINALQFFVDAGIWIVLFGLPVLVIIALPFVVLWYVVRWLRRRKRKSTG
ncbi:MAG TPA: DUF4349 domain-containing protein [Anaerolineae bacterium]|nr:DUF4349 domain-containing protein [Anaerolineae bacterium]HIP96976.1 DUF4349 domain-containing protein [Anaerolineae bacterium]